MYDIKSMKENEIAQIVSHEGEPAFRAGQIFKWLGAGVSSFDEMTNIPLALRERLKETCLLYRPKCLNKQVASDGTVKLLWELFDKNAIESVVMSYNHGNTVCISSQVGCRMGCAFCASTRGGLVRNLTASEMLDQVRYSGFKAEKKISNIVIMGIGEPLDNFENVIRFLELVNHPDVLGIGMRHISLSTSGPEGGTRRLADEGLQITLSVSLHAPDDATRNIMMPINRKGGVARLIDDCRYYCLKTGRRISFEYIMAKGINDSDTHANSLITLLNGMSSELSPLIHVNLIPLNSVEGSAFRPSDPDRVSAFAEALKKGGIRTTVRRRMGADIDAACGQLRLKRRAQSPDRR
jgi:23S rRNA (adenine2503-C2)-methyltransferase